MVVEEAEGRGREVLSARVSGGGGIESVETEGEAVEAEAEIEAVEGGVEEEEEGAAEGDAGSSMG